MSWWHGPRENRKTQRSNLWNLWRKHVCFLLFRFAFFSITPKILSRWIIVDIDFPQNRNIRCPSRPRNKPVQMCFCQTCGHFMLRKKNATCWLGWEGRTKQWLRTPMSFVFICFVYLCWFLKVYPSHLFFTKITENPVLCHQFSAVFWCPTEPRTSVPSFHPRHGHCSLEPQWGPNDQEHPRTNHNQQKYMLNYFLIFPKRISLVVRDVQNESPNPKTKRQRLQNHNPQKIHGGAMRLFPNFFKGNMGKQRDDMRKLGQTQKKGQT